MLLAPGRRLGVYEVLSVIGAGGMGEVYRARDTTLQRDVALKVLTESVVRDAERLARFRREAQVLAALNHPNIAAIYGVEESAGTPALVLELVEGQTLADRLARGAMPLGEALPIAAQIVEALEAAHAQGIVHRDLKPANVTLRADGTVKVLDFGLAKALDTSAAPANPDLSPTITSPALTRAGFILGTAAYMSPEQARGRAADARSDIWAFGVVLYEILTGQRLFKGDDVADTLAAVLRAEPAWTALPPGTLPSIRRLLRRCLEKDPKRRLQHIGDARLELEEASGPEAAPIVATMPVRGWWQLAVAALAGAAAVALVAWMRSPPAPARGVTRFAVQASNLAPRVIGTGSSVALSPDGQTIVYVVSGTGPGLVRRRLGELTAEPIRGTEGGRRPFFSPDSRSIGFFADGQLKRVPVEGGTPVVLAEAPVQASADWADDGTIVLVRPDLSRVPASGGVVQTVVAASDAIGQFREGDVLPGSKAVLVQNRQPPNPGYIEAVELATGARHRLIEGGSPKLAASGELLFVRQGKIWGVPFDAARLAITGTPVPLIDSVGLSEGDAGEGGFATALDGSLVYIAGEASSSLVWLDRQGAATAAWPEELQMRNPRLSPDGRRVVANSIRGADLWLFDLERGARLRLTTEGYNRGGAWSPDGERFAFFTAPTAPQLGVGVTQDLHAIGADGGSPVRLLDRPGPQWADSWSPDGRSLVFDDGPGYSRDLWVLPVGGQPRALVATRFNERGGAVAPDGRWLAFVSDESGRDEIYAQPFPDPGAKLPVSTAGGVQPVWARDGRELYYREGEWLMAVAVQAAPFRVSAPRRIFEMPVALYGFDPFVADYDVAADGRFLAVRRQGSAEIHVVLNWGDELRRAMGR